jgi:hypothetical protein
LFSAGRDDAPALAARTIENKDFITGCEFWKK